MKKISCLVLALGVVLVASTDAQALGRRGRCGGGGYSGCGQSYGGCGQTFYGGGCGQSYGQVYYGGSCGSCQSYTYAPAAPTYQPQQSCPTCQVVYTTTGQPLYLVNGTYYAQMPQYAQAPQYTQPQSPSAQAIQPATNKGIERASAPAPAPKPLFERIDPQPDRPKVKRPAPSSRDD